MSSITDLMKHVEVLYDIVFDYKLEMPLSQSERCDEAYAAIQRIAKELSVSESVSTEDELDSTNFIEDGFGSRWSAVCPMCKRRTMQVVRPGKVQCSICG